MGWCRRRINDLEGCVVFVDILLVLLLLSSCVCVNTWVCLEYRQVRSMISWVGMAACVTLIATRQMSERLEYGMRLRYHSQARLELITVDDFSRVNRFTHSSQPYRLISRLTDSSHKAYVLISQRLPII
jgi:hypothetical protein